MTALLELRGLTVELPTTLRSASGGSGQALGWVRPVNDVSLRLERGAALGLVGESGSGKTMLALALMGLLPAGARVSGSALYHAVQGSLASEASRDSSVDLAALGEDEWGGIRGRRIAMTSGYMPVGSTFNGKQNILSDKYFRSLKVGDVLENDDWNPVL